MVRDRHRRRDEQPLARGLGLGDARRDDPHVELPPEPLTLRHRAAADHATTTIASDDALATGQDRMLKVLRRAPRGELDAPGGHREQRRDALDEHLGVRELVAIERDPAAGRYFLVVKRHDPYTTRHC